MRIKNLTIKAHYLGDELAFFSFHRDFKENSFATLDGGFCTHEKFKHFRDLYNNKCYTQLVEIVATRHNKQPLNFNIVEGNALKDNWTEIYTTQPVFTAKELL